MTLTRHEYSKEKCQSRGRRNILQFGRPEQKGLGNEESSHTGYSPVLQACALVDFYGFLKKRPLFASLEIEENKD